MKNASVVPLSVQRVVEAWRTTSSPEQAAIAWHRSNWMMAFPAHRHILGALPERLSRAVVRQACRTASSGPDEAEGGFLVMMIWGYGTGGLGAFRTKRILTVNDQAATLLQRAAYVVAMSGALEGYRCLATSSRLRYLGPAFGTKFLYFCSREDRPPALILDKLVSQWLAENVGLALDPVPWDIDAYARYIDVMTAWADELSLRSDQLEACIFSVQATLASSLWGT